MGAWHDVLTLSCPEVPARRPPRGPTLISAQMPLQNEIDNRRRLIKTDSYSMSIGELMNLYQSKELDLHPDFQRFFRWTEEQKTKLIESILLGIPLPPVFVSQRADGVWDVIDGLQRLSAIFQFAGILQDADGKLLPPLKLLRAKYLTSLEDMVWEKKEGEAGNELSSQQRIDIKRSKMDVNIILRESSPDAKYDMFERLNTGGTQLSEQEVRNCLLLMSNKEFFSWIDGLASDPNFTNVVSLSDQKREERYDMELVVRFVTLRTIAIDDLKGIVDVGTFLTDRIVELSTENFDTAEEGRVFEKTFRLLDEALKDNAFRRYDAERTRFTGGFLVSVFEVVGIGLGSQVDKWEGVQAELDEIGRLAKSIWANKEFTGYQGSGVRGTTRLPHTISLGRELFNR